jgi:hypothetical protein
MLLVSGVLSWHQSRWRRGRFPVLVIPPCFPRYGDVRETLMERAFPHIGSLLQAADSRWEAIRTGESYAPWTRAILCLGRALRPGREGARVSQEATLSRPYPAYGCRVTLRNVTSPWCLLSPCSPNIACPLPTYVLGYRGERSMESLASATALRCLFLCVDGPDGRSPIRLGRLSSLTLLDIHLPISAMPMPQCLDTDTTCGGAARRRTSTAAPR